MKGLVRKILGSILILAGIVLYAFSDYIADQVHQGKKQIREGQQNVNTIRNISGLSPYTKDVGGMVADSGQKKIDAGKEQVIQYTALANQIHLGATILVIGGVALVGLGFIHRRKK